MPSNYAYTGHYKQGPHAERGTMTSTLNRITIARTGTEAQRQALINDEARVVRATVAGYGTEAQRQALTVAECGTDDQRQELINDPDWYVRAAVARYGSDDQRQALINDEDERVRVAANGN